jgi:hypothetical protein
MRKAGITLWVIAVVAALAGGGLILRSHLDPIQHPQPAAATSPATQTPATTTTSTIPPTTSPPTTNPPTTITPVVALTNPDDLYAALEQAAQQLMGMNVNQAGLDSFIAWYHQQQTGYQTGQTGITPAAPYDAAIAWINKNYPTQVLAYRYLNDANAINCMIRDAGPGPCPTATFPKPHQCHSSPPQPSPDKSTQSVTPCYPSSPSPASSS